MSLVSLWGDLVDISPEYSTCNRYFEPGRMEFNLGLDVLGLPYYCHGALVQYCSCKFGCMHCGVQYPFHNIGQGADLYLPMDPFTCSLCKAARDRQAANDGGRMQCQAFARPGSEADDGELWTEIRPLPVSVDQLIMARRGYLLTLQTTGVIRNDGFVMYGMTDTDPTALAFLYQKRRTWTYRRGQPKLVSHHSDYPYPRRVPTLVASQMYGYTVGPRKLDRRAVPDFCDERPGVVLGQMEWLGRGGVSLTHVRMP